MREDELWLLTHTSLFAAVMSKARYLFASRIEDGVGTVHTMGLIGGIDVQGMWAFFSPGRAFRHDFALQSNAAHRAGALGQKYKWLSNLLMERHICSFWGAATASASRCGTLT